MILFETFTYVSWNSIDCPNLNKTLKLYAHNSFKLTWPTGHVSVCHHFRPLTFHILIFFPKAGWPNELKVSRVYLLKVLCKYCSHRQFLFLVGQFPKLVWKQLLKVLLFVPQQLTNMAVIFFFNEILRKLALNTNQSIKAILVSGSSISKKIFSSETTFFYIYGMETHYPDSEPTSVLYLLLNVACIVERVSDCCLMPTQQLLSYIMATTS